MIKKILVSIDGSNHAGAATQYGIFLAKKLDAALTAIHVMDSRMLEGPLMADVSGWIGAQPYGVQLQQFRELLQKRGESVVQSFNDVCDREGIDHEVETKMGHPSRVILDEEVKTELVIIGQKGEHAVFGGDLIGSNTERIARNSIKPCLVVPEVFQPVDRILVAYDGSGHASQALHEAIELAQALAVELVILTVSERGRRHDINQTSADGLKLAEAHKCNARAIVQEGVPEDMILDQAQQQHCDLIVAGAHGHGRIREMFIGSTTTRLLVRSTLPVLIVR